MRYNGAGGKLSGTKLSTGKIEFTNLSLDHSNTPMWPTMMSPLQSRVMKFNGSTWEAVGPATAYLLVQRFISAWRWTAAAHLICIRG